MLTNETRYDIIRLQMKIDFNSTCGILVQGAHDGKMENWKLKSISESKNENRNQ